MSLLDDVSIVVTPNGYKAGTLYGVLPTYAEGSEELNNTDFATETVWTFTNVDFSVGAVLFDNVSDTVFQNWTDTVNTTYKLTITKTGAGTLRFRSGYTGSAATIIDIPESGIIYFTSTSDTNRIQIYGDSGSVNATLNSVSVKEVTSSDMDVTRATAATRVDENGLVNYAEILGEEEITNGDFATDLSGWTLSNTDVSNTIVWNNGRVDMTADGTSALLLAQTVFEVGKTYKIELDAYNITGSGFKIYDTSEVLVMQSDGHYTLYHTAGTTSLNIYRYTGGQASSGEFDNISVKEVTRDNVPRIDYTGGGCPHILAEPQRTNLIPYSEDLTNAFYLTTGIVTVTESTTLSPDGTSYGYTITPTSSATNHYFNYDYGQLTVVIGDEVTYSIFVKPNGYNFIQIASSSGFPAKYQNFELTGDGVIGTGDISGKTIEKIGDWYRCSVTETASGVNPRFLLSPSETALATRNPVYSNNGTDGVLGWGVQLEVGSYGTSYISNFGTVAGVTRNQDIFTRDGIGSLINSEEGVLFVEMATLSNDLSYRYITLSDGTNSNYVIIRYYNNSNRISAYLVNSGGTQGSTAFTISDVTSFSKVAFKWKVNDFALWIDGAERSTQSSGTTFSSGVLNSLYFSEADGAGNNFYGKVKQLQVYTSALTDSQLKDLTT